MRVISESEELVQGIEDPFLGASLYPPSTSPPIYWINNVWPERQSCIWLGSAGGQF